MIRRLSILFLLGLVCIYSEAQTIPDHAMTIIKAYPQFRLHYNDNAIVFVDGTKIVYDDGKKKGFVEMLDNCDIEDMFSMSYDAKSSVPGYLNDCGRGRKGGAVFRKQQREGGTQTDSQRKAGRCKAVIGDSAKRQCG